MIRRQTSGIWALVLVTWILWSGPLIAKVEVFGFDEPAKESLYQEMIRELRCLVCQNQNLADSNAELAQDLRRKTRDLILDGKSRRQIIDYMVSRYGDFVLYRPRFNLMTAFLWLSPVCLFVFLLWWILRWRRRVSTVISGYSEDDHLRARSLLREPPPHDATPLSGESK